MKIGTSWLSTLLLVCMSMAVGLPAAFAGDAEAGAQSSAIPETLSGAESTTDECASESPLTAACGKCGDGHCTPQCGETARSCPKDCGVESELLAKSCSKCGDGHCTPQCGETAQSCPKDCGVELELLAKRCSKCGDGHCTPQCGENEQTCPRDCAVATEQAIGEVGF